LAVGRWQLAVGSGQKSGVGIGIGIGIETPSPAVLTTAVEPPTPIALRTPHAASRTPPRLTLAITNLHHIHHANST